MKRRQICVKQMRYLEFLDDEGWVVGEIVNGDKFEGVEDDYEETNCEECSSEWRVLEVPGFEVGYRVVHMFVFYFII